MGLIVIDPGLSTTVQDLGRPGYREWGVPPGGAFDRGAAGLANALVGNDSAHAVLELTLIGGTYEASRPLAMAIAGAPMEATVIDPSGARRPLDMPLSWSMQPGERVVLGRAIEGARAYLAVRGGWRTPIRLGSRSSEERLRAGDVLPAETGAIPTRRPSILLWEAPAAEPFRAVNGPDAVAAGASIWLGARFRVGSRSDRMGLRLEGDPVAVSAPAGRLSAPVAAGAVQLAGGQVIVLGAAAGTIGGYPHVAHVISADLDRLGQLRPGDVIRFRRVDIDEARREDRERQRARSALLGRIAALAQGP